jgi:hypothetical protein
MGKDRSIPHLEALTAFLKSGEGVLPEPLRADAERARTALARQDTGALVALPKEVQVAAVEVLAAARQADALVVLESQTPHKEVRKAAGKACHTLKTKGVKVADTPLSGDAFRFHTVEGEEARSYASLADPEGDRMVWFGHQVKQRGRMAFQAVVNEVSGIALFQTFPQMTAKMRRRILDELLGGKIPVFEIDNAYARWLIEEGVRRNRAAGTEVPKEYFEAEPLMGPAPDFASDPHPLYALLLDKGAAGEPTAAELRQGASLLDLEEIQAWRPGVEILEKLREQLNLGSESVLHLTPEQRREQFQASIERAAREHFAGEVRDRWVRRLLDLGHCLAVTDRLPLCRVALAVAEEMGREGSDPAQSPFVLELFHRALRAEEEHAHGPEDEGPDEGSVLVTP